MRLRPHRGDGGWTRTGSMNTHPSLFDQPFGFTREDVERLRAAGEVTRLTDSACVG